MKQSSESPYHRTLFRWEVVKTIRLKKIQGGIISWLIFTPTTILTIELKKSHAIFEKN